MYSVYQHWDPLEVCMVGKSYPPEFFDFIKNADTRRKFQTLSEETEEDFQQLITLLHQFGVEVLRPDIPEDFEQLFVGSKWVQPPVAPRDYSIMIADEMWIPQIPNGSHAWNTFYRNYKKPEWSDFVRPEDFYNALPHEIPELHARFNDFKRIDQAQLDVKLGFYDRIFKQIVGTGSAICHTNLDFINGCFVSRIGKDLYFATQTYHDDQAKISEQVNSLFRDTRNHVVNAGGHGDATYCPVTSGLIISLQDIPTYADSFPDWEVVYLPPSNYSHMREFQASMKHNKGRWFIPGFENNQDLINSVDYYFDDWVGNVAETVFDVNILIIDPKNIVVSTHSDQVESACARYGITVHVVPFRHKFFWDAGMHCVTNDISRRGTRQDFFPNRNDTAV